MTIAFTSPVPGQVSAPDAMEIPSPLVIGFCGKAGAGKSTAARYLHDGFGFTRLRFADILKRMLVTLLEAQGVGFSVAWSMVDGDLKEVASPYLGGHTPRHAMQTLGNEWGRNLIGSTFWVNAWKQAVAKAGIEAFTAERRARIVVDDVRYPNEAAAIASLGGTLVEIWRPGMAAPSGQHISEQHRFQPRFTVVNGGTVDDFHQRLESGFHNACVDIFD